jgi:hypothetical protein
MLFGCDISGEPRPPLGSQTAATATAAAQVKTRIAATDLNSSSMRLNYFHVTYFEFSRFKYPIINFSFPEKADYIQIIRCRADAQLGDLGNIEIGASNKSAADKKYLNTDYWKDISSAVGCVTIAASVSIDRFVDYFAGSGNWVYVGRACVQPSRLPLNSGLPTVNPCSRQVSKTSEIRGYVNKENEISAAKKAEMISQRDKIDSFGRNLIYKAKQLDSEIARCESERGANRASQQRRSSVSQLMGIGIGLGAKLIKEPALKAAAIGLDFNNIFGGLLAKDQDFLPPDFCPAAERLMREMDVDKQQLMIETESYNQSLEFFGEPV